MMILLAHVGLLVVGALLGFAFYLYAYGRGWDAAHHYYGEIYPPLLGPDHDIL